MKLSHYEWDPEKDLVAEGGFAEVFKARDLHAANRWVALKIYKEAVSRGTEGSTGQKKYSLEQEFARIDGLSHTNIVSYYGLEYLQHQDHVGRTSNYPILIMEYAGEGTLSELMQKSISPEDTLRIVRGVIEAMAYLHDQGIIHRDLKPGNILFTKDRNGRLVPKVTDFGISRDILGEKTIEQSFTEGVGTPHYMAPEQFFKKKFGLQEAVSERTDLWAIGVILYRMLTGELPFGHGQKDYELIRDEIVDKAPDLSKIPDNFKGLIMSCLQKKAVDRAASAQELLMFLEPERTMTMARSSGAQQDLGGTQILSSGTGKSQQGQELDQPSTPSKKSGKMIWTVVLSIAIILALGFGGFSWYRHVKVQDLLNSAEAHYKSGEFKEAYEVYVKASEYSSGRAYYFLSSMNVNGTGTDKDYPKALQYADLALEQNYNMAAFQKGLMYQNGQGVLIDSIESLGLFKKGYNHIEELANNQDSEAQKLLGLYYYYGYVGDKDLTRSFEITKEAAEKGNPSAMANLAYLYYNGEGVVKDCQQALHWYEKAANINFDLGYSGLGSLYYNGCDSISVNYNKALEYYEISANLGNLAAMQTVGSIYHYGKGVPVDIDEALIWYRKAAAEGHITSMNSAGLIYEKKKNWSTAKAWFLMAAQKNDTYGAYNLARLFNNKEAGTFNQDSAAHWFRPAAKQGHSTAAWNLGWHFYHGKGAVQSYDSAYYWYQNSALAGNSIGQYYTGMMYADSINWKLNYDSAYHYYELSANQGSGYGQFGLGDLYYWGRGVKKDHDKALSYFEPASEQGLSGAQYMAGFINNQKGNREKAKSYHLKAAQQKHSAAQAELAKIYFLEGAKSNNDTFYWSNKSAQNENPEGMRLLGLCYYYGIGTTKNKSEARTWILKSCQLKNQSACKDLGELL